GGGGHQRRRGGDLGALLRQRGQDEDLLRLRRPEPGGHPPHGGEEQAARGPHHPGHGARPLLLPLARARNPGVAFPAGPAYHATRRLHMTGETDRIEKTILLRAPRARVWRALTEAAEFGSWFGVKLPPG